MLATQILELNKPANIGKYQVESVLGRGAMGVVYKAYDPFIKRKVAIKTIHKSLLSSEMGEEILARFATEAEAVGRLTHPNIVSIFDFDEFEGAPYFVMEFVEGVELKAMLQDPDSITLAGAISIVGEVLDGLAYIHQLGIIHRDIKPANIFVMTNGGVKIADFGIARLENSDYTQMGRVLGTPSYMSPEQCKGVVLDERSDLFSLAIIFFEMVSGVKAFSGVTAQETMHKVVNETCQMTGQLAAKLPRGFQQFFEKALAKQPQDRFQSAIEFKQALLQIVKGREGFPQQENERSNRKIGLPVLAAGGLALLVGYLTLQIWYVAHYQSRDKLDGKDAALPVVEVQQQGESTSIKSSVIVAKVLSAAEMAKVERLLKVAKAHLLVQRLVAPQGSNAYDAYKLVLTIDPSNSDAKTGLMLVEEKLIERVGALQKGGKVAEFNALVDLGEKLYPESGRWRQFK